MSQLSNPALLDGRKCAECVHFGHETDGEYGEIDCGYTCDRKPHLANLRSFPFRKEQPCFVENFWFSEFAGLVDESDESHKRAAALWREKWKHKLELASKDGGE